jgi:GH35 family endo-1,4-beta-xylanase
MTRPQAGLEWQLLEQKKKDLYDPTHAKSTIEAARGRIDSLRRRDVDLCLLDRQGRPLAGREVQVVQTDSDFLWGFCGWRWLAAMADGSFHRPPFEHRRRLFAELFNSINLMHYWAEKHCTDAPTSEEYQGCPTYDVLDRMVDWAVAHGLTPKGHPLYWPVPKALPDWLGKYDYQTRRRFLEVRIRTIAARFRGRIRLYDAVNEMMWEPTMLHTAERHWPHIEPVEAIADEAADVLQWARQEDPDARYTLNEYGLRAGDPTPIPYVANDGTTVTRASQLERFIAMGRCLVDRGTPPDAMGLQTPAGDWNDHDLEVATYDAVGTRTGLPVHITEMRPGEERLEKAGMPPDEAAAMLAEYLENTFVCAFGNGHVEAYYLWSDCRLIGGRGGHNDGRFPTVVYERLHSLLRRQWRTNETLRTDADGRVRFRGFTGRYQLRVRRPGGQATGFAMDLPRTLVGGLKAEMKLDV